MLRTMTAGLISSKGMELQGPKAGTDAGSRGGAGATSSCQGAPFSAIGSVAVTF